MGLQIHLHAADLTVAVEHNSVRLEWGRLNYKVHDKVTAVRGGGGLCPQTDPHSKDSSFIKQTVSLTVSLMTEGSKEDGLKTVETQRETG